MQVQIISELLEAAPMELAFVALVLALLVLGMAMRAIILLIKERK
jgi:hypothetical protein